MITSGKSCRELVGIICIVQNYEADVIPSKAVPLLLDTGDVSSFANLFAANAVRRNFSGSACPVYGCSGWRIARFGPLTTLTTVQVRQDIHQMCHHLFNYSGRYLIVLICHPRPEGFEINFLLQRSKPFPLNPNRLLFNRFLSSSNGESEPII